MVEIRFDKKFVEIFSKLDNFIRTKIQKQIKKISDNPEVGKPMRNVRKGTRELYIKPFRLSYLIINKDLIYILGLYHKKQQ
ncbi:type II toxin-antitoxin system RelE/ParE family toxin [archaeon]|jgi:mRNA-degrading endonuclease RelE of RelBE toxin-antitoxin system|nr:type II toxin-antitoxin system RelE/ParE family toxin [archaeon]MBT4373239.1 type II toxin-antitoxin system RelE/ParE family toxin [archaeon]MBT4531584.1 type II toxin-antitoxin system RelE/ParE family toxin [archaeon]MBT7001238.1 type II toxin-antitoxin system RelE/ParE family toxin [archaeon]MBT7282276.1 type II toxin-antitoxin system RelE/ParE family toxin [archaeon]